MRQKLKKREFMATCYHEAGHVVFGWLFKADVQVARVFEERNEGEVFFEPARSTKQRVAIAYGAAGGPSAEALYYKLIGKGDDANFHHYCLWSSADFQLIGFDDENFSTLSNPYSLVTERLLQHETVRAAVVFFSGVLYSQRMVAGDDVAGLMKQLIPSRKAILPS